MHWCPFSEAVHVGCLPAASLQGSLTGARRRPTISHTPTHMHTHTHIPSSKAGFESLGLGPEPKFKSLPQVGLRGLGRRSTMRRNETQSLEHPASQPSAPIGGGSRGGVGAGHCLSCLDGGIQGPAGLAGGWSCLRMPLIPPSIYFFPLFGSS